MGWGGWLRHTDLVQGPSPPRIAHILAALRRLAWPTCPEAPRFGHLPCCSGAFSAFQLVPSNVNDDDPSTCPGPAFSTDEIPAGVRDALNCIFTAYNNSRGEPALTASAHTTGTAGSW